MDYQNVYSKLYRLGYHKDPEYSHAKPLCSYLRKNYEFDSILDVGCSRGWVLRYFSDKEATGIDVSEPAIEYCKEQGLDARLRSAVELMYPTQFPAIASFDCVISTDCLEHLSTHDAVSACKGIRHTARKLIAVKIPNEIDRAHWKHEAGMNLHLTVQPLSWWEMHLARKGDRVVSPMKDTIIIERGAKRRWRETIG